MPSPAPTPSDESSVGRVPSRLRLATFNLRSARQGGLQHACRCLERHNVDIAVLTETKIDDDIYTRSSYGYRILCTKAPSHRAGGVALAVRDVDPSAPWLVESEKIEGPNLLSFQLLCGVNRFLVIGVYSPPNAMAPAITADQVAAILQRHPGMPRIILGDLNANPHRTELRDQDVAMSAAWAQWGVSDIGDHFLHPSRTRQATWWQRRGDTVHESTCDYILSDVRSKFVSHRAVNPEHYNSDHRLLRSDLLIHRPDYIRRYRARRTRPPVIPIREPHSDVELDFAAMKEAKEERHPQPSWKKRPWISEGCMTLMDDRARLIAERPTDERNSTIARIKRRIKRRLRQDRKRYVKEAGDDIEALLKCKDANGAWQRLKSWYRAATGRIPSPTYADLRSVEQQFTNLYAARQPPGDPIPTYVDPFPISDEIPDEEEIVAALKRLRNGKASGGSGLRAEDLKAWHKDFDPSKHDSDHPWVRLVRSIQTAFSQGQLPTAMSTAILIVLPKPDGGKRGLGLVEPMWKLISNIIDTRIKDSVVFDDSLHGFLPNRSCGTAIIDARLRLDVATANHVVLYQIFLDLSKAYDNADRERLLEILKAYGVGPRIRRVLVAFWDNHFVVPRQNGYYGRSFRAFCGVIQGDPVSPTLFNILVDAVVRAWKAQRPPPDPDIPDSLRTDVSFYADDGKIGSVLSEETQDSLDTLTDLFQRGGLSMNARKTKGMIGTSGPSSGPLADRHYTARMTGAGRGVPQRSVKVNCPTCNVEVTQQSLRRHVERFHPDVLAVSAVPASSSTTESASYTVDIGTQTVRPAVPCPVPGCPGRATRRHTMVTHFKTRHPTCQLIIPGMKSKVACGNCGVLYAASHLKRHQKSARCASDARARRRAALRESQATADAVVFTVDGVPIENVDTFPYLGRPICKDGSDWAAARYNIAQATKQWGKIKRVLAREGATPRISSKFYVAVVQSVLLYGTETWVITDRIRMALERFHHQAARMLAGKPIRYIEKFDTWVYPRTAKVLEKAGLWTMTEYLQRRRVYCMNYVQAHQAFADGVATRLDGTMSNRKFLWNAGHYD